MFRIETIHKILNNPVNPVYFHCFSASSWANGQPLIDLFTQSFNRQILVGDQLVINKNSGCGIDPAGAGSPRVLRYDGYYLKPVHVSGKARDVQPYLAREIDQDRAEIAHLAPERLVLVKQVVHLPELPLKTGGRRGVGGFERMVVKLSQREVVKGDLNPTAVFALQSFEDRVQSAAGWALIIAVLIDCNNPFGGRPVGRRA